MVGNVEINLPEKATEEATNFLQRLFGSIAETSEYLGDKIRYVRWKSAVKRLQAAAKFAEEAEIKPSEVPVKFLVPFLEKSSLEDDGSELADMWARLLANASDKFVWKQALFPDILSQIGPNEANLLRRLVHSAFEYAHDLSEQLLMHDVSGRVRRSELVSVDILAHWNASSDEWRRRSNEKPHEEAHSLELFLRSVGHALLDKNLLYLNITILTESGDRIDGDFFYADNYDDLIDSVVILERQGLVEQRISKHTAGSIAVDILSVSATKLGFDLVANCDHVPAVKIHSTRALRSASLTKTAKDEIRQRKAEKKNRSSSV